MNTTIRFLAAAALLLLPLLMSGCGSSSGTTAGSSTRVYYIRAVEQQWDYAPKLAARMTPAGLSPTPGYTFTPDTATYMLPIAGTRIGSKYQKARFIGYSSTATAMADPSMGHIGIIGPPLKAEVGDTIEVHFSNQTSYALNLHPEGVLYDSDAIVQPGQKKIYKWTVTAGPGFNDTSSIVLKYFCSQANNPSPGPAVTAAQFEDAGLLGPIVIYAKGALGSGYTVGGLTEFFTVFKKFNENNSPYLSQSELAAGIPVATTANTESNRKYTVNGYLFGNMTTLVATRGAKSRWYVMSGFTDTDTYLPYWEGNPVLYLQQARTSFQLFPSENLVVEMTPLNPASGTGMFPFYTVAEGQKGMFGWLLVK